MAELELIGVPFDGYGRTGNQALAPRVLREHGLVEACDVHTVVAVDDIDLPAPSPRRGIDTSLINEPALMAMFRQIVANNRAGGWRKIKAASGDT